MRPRLLNAKERKRLLTQLEMQYACDASRLKGYAFLLTEGSGRLYFVNEEVLDAVRDLTVDSLGLYLGTLLKNGEIRLSVEGSQLLGPSAEQVLVLDDEAAHEWVRGGEPAFATELSGFVIVKHGEDFLGCGKVVFVEKSGLTVIHNYVPKTRYVRCA